MDPLERQIAEAVNVDPSPEFVARVRARVAAEDTPVVRWRMSPFLVAGATVAVIMITVWVTRIDRAPVQTPPVAGVDIPLAAPVHVANRTTAPPLVRTAHSRPQPLAQLIIASDDIRGLRRLSDLLRNGTVALPFDDVRSSPVKEIAVAPIDIAPLTVASIGQQGDEQ
jgi:hypothetical protein